MAQRKAKARSDEMNRRQVYPWLWSSTPWLLELGTQVRCLALALSSSDVPASILDATVPIAIPTLIIFCSSFIMVRHDLTSGVERTVRLNSTFQLKAVTNALYPMLLFSFLVSSLLEGSLNDRLNHTRSQKFNMLLTQLYTASMTIFVWQDGPFQTVWKGLGASAGATGGYWLWLAFAFNLTPSVIYLVQHKLRHSIVQRERWNRGAHAYILTQTSLYGGIFVGFLLTCLLVTCHAYSFPFIPVEASSSILSGICAEQFNATYIARNCVTEIRTDTVGLFSASGWHGDAFLGTKAANLGIPRLTCTDPAAIPGLPSYGSLYDACVDSWLSEEIVLMSTLNSGVTGLLLGTYVYKEAVHGLDDTLTAKNFISITLGSDQRRAGVWKPFVGRLFLCSVILMAVGVLILVVSNVSAIVFTVMRTTAYSQFLTIFQVVGIGSQCVSFICLFAIYRHRRAYKNEMTPQERADLDEAKARVAQEEDGGICSFYFVPAAYIRESRETTLPRLQDLQKTGCNIKRINISREQAYSQTALPKKYLVISHRWLDPNEPDKGGEQMRKIKEHLNKDENAGIEWVWYDCKAARCVEFEPPERFPPYPSWVDVCPRARA